MKISLESKKKYFHRLILLLLANYTNKAFEDS